MDDQEVAKTALAESATGMTKRLFLAVETYLQYHSIEGSTEATQAFYRKELGAFLQWLERQQLHQIKAPDILKHLQTLKDRGSAPRTIRTRLQAIRTFFKWALMWELIEINPAEHLRPPRVPKTRKGFLTQEQFQAMLDISPLSCLVGARRQSMLWLLITTGIRRREFAMLNRDDLDWQKGEIRIIHGKGQKERRVAFHKEAQRATMWYFHYRHDNYPCLWVTEGSRPLTYWGISQDIKRTMDRAGVHVQDVMHVFRRTAAANAARQGIPRAWIMAGFGWSTSAMIEHYTRQMEEEEGAIEAFKRLEPFGKG